jgi:hypothetical protein
MNPSLLGAAAATLLVALWLVTRRQPRPFLRSADASAVAALNRAQRELVTPHPGSVSAPPSKAASSPPAPQPLPSRADQRGRAQLLARLSAAALGSQPERLDAMRTARRWGHPDTLPLLRRGLRDVHPAVVREAAQALETFRGRTRAGSHGRR